MNQSVEITSRSVEGCFVLKIDAPHFTYPYSSSLKTAIEELLTPETAYFVLDCSAIELIDSYGLASIVSALKVIRDHNGGLALFGLNSTFEKLVDLTHLNKVLEIWPSEGQAIVYLNGLKQDAKKRAKKSSTEGPASK